MTTQASRIEAAPAAPWQIAVSVEALAYAAIIVGALLLRGFGLGDVPLSPAEARQAAAASHLPSPADVGVGQIDSLLIFGGAAVAFAVASPTAAAARWLPLIAGLCLTLSPLMFRERLGRVPTLLATLLLAFSSSAIVTSRQMTGVGLAMLSVLIALKCLDWHLSSKNVASFVACGVALAVALLSDFAAPLIAVSAALGFGFAMLTDEEGQLTRDVVRQTWEQLPWPGFLIGFIAALVALGTLFFIAPQGLGAAADLWGRFFSGILIRPANTPYLGLVIGVYEPLLVVFGLIGAWIASQSPQPVLRFLAGWGVASLLVSLVYPGALPVHGLWSAVPLAALSAIALSDLAHIEHDAPRWAVWAHAVAVAATLAMIFNRVSHQLRAPMTLPIFKDVVSGVPGLSVQLDMVWLVIAAVLLILFWLAVASFWEPNAALQGLGLGLALPGLLLMLGQSVSLAVVRQTSPYELINPYPAQDGVNRLAATAQEISEIAAGDRRTASITVQGQADSLVAFALQRFTNITFVERPTPNIQSVMVITPADGSSPFLGSSYIGQDFVVASQWDFASLDANQALLWLLYRAADSSTVRQERVILWVREDVYRLVPQDTNR